MRRAARMADGRPLMHETDASPRAERGAPDPDPAGPLTQQASTDDPLTDDALTGTYRVWQRKRGHRYSIDDVLSAHQACIARPDASHYVDLGCGIGSVLLMVSYKLPHARALGIEAQAVSFELAVRNVARNGQRERITVQRGDLRTLRGEPERRAVLATLGQPQGVQLVSGTPPYMPVGTSTPSPDAQRRYARVELRGGVEDYLASMGPLLAPGGRAVVCCDARTPERAQRGAAAAGLTPLRRLDAIPREGAQALFSVWTLGRTLDLPPSTPCETEHFVARDADGQRTSAYRALRAFFDLDPRAPHETT